jgi:BMFP domain-containing protein YqiC
MFRPLFVPALLCAGLIAAAGCGGTSKEDFAKKADEICQDVEKNIRKIGQGGTRTPQQAGQQIDGVKKESRDGVSRLRDLEKPDGDDGEKAEQFVNTLDRELNGQAIPALEELESSVRARDRKRAASAIQKLQALENSQSDKYARDVGAEDCAR